METDATITLSSIYRGQLLFKLALSYGKLNFLRPASGMGKTALGLFLRDESYRRLGIETSGPVFVPKVDWEIAVEGPLGFVEYLSGEGERGTLKDHLNLKGPLETLFKQKGKSSCSQCGLELFARESREFADQISEQKTNYALLGIGISIKPEEIFSVLDWARSHSISRLLVSDKILSLPKVKDNDAAFGKSMFGAGTSKINLVLLREIMECNSIDADFGSSIGNVVTLSEVAASTLSSKTSPRLLLGEIVSGAERVFTGKKEIDLSSKYLCINCGSGYATLPESKVNGLSLSQFEQIKLGTLRDFFKEHFAADWLRLFELDVNEISLTQHLDELSSDLLVELRLLSLILSETRDTLIFIDSRLSKRGKIYAVELSMLDNCLVSQLEEGSSLKDLLPKELQRTSEILDKKKYQKSHAGRKNSIEPLLIESGLEKPIVELYASLPEARIRNLSVKELSFHAAKCPECGGSGYSVINISSLGKRAEVCKTCFGSRYQEQIQFVKYQETTLARVLELSIKEASELFAKRPEISGKLTHLIQMGLENYRLGDEWRTLPSKAKLILQVEFH